MLHSQAQNSLILSTSKTLPHAKKKHKPKHTRSKEWRCKHDYLFLSTTKTLPYARKKKTTKPSTQDQRNGVASKPSVENLLSILWLVLVARGKDQSSPNTRLCPSPCCAAVAAALHSRRQKQEHQTHQRVANLSLTSSYHITSITETLQIPPHQIQPLRTTCNQNTSRWVANQNYRVGLEFVWNRLQFQLDFCRSSFTILLKTICPTCFTCIRIIVFVFGRCLCFWFLAKVGFVP